MKNFQIKIIHYIGTSTTYVGMHTNVLKQILEFGKKSFLDF
jgi:hypothetical protein